MEREIDDSSLNAPAVIQSAAIEMSEHHRGTGPRATSARLTAGLASALVAATVLHAQLPTEITASLRWTRIPAGMFQMGCVPADSRCEADEQPRHDVVLSRPFDLMAAEVTVGMYRAVSPSMREQPAWSRTPDHPVTLVTWDDARRFCEAVAGRLPTEAEWEYAARGGRAGAVYPWGDDAPSEKTGAAGGVSFESDAARAVRSFLPNSYGLYDMAGNAWEWVAD